MFGTKTGRPQALLTTVSLLALAMAGVQAQDLPSGGQVMAGTATIGQSGSSLTVTQSSATAILNWSSFSLGSGASAHFANGGGATLNRVTGALPSVLNGSLTATGSVYLVNPAGIAVGSGGVVRTGGSFVGSTLDLTNAEFAKGGTLQLSGSSTAGVINLGSITSDHGDVVLSARRVENAGSIAAPEGSIGLLAGYAVELRDTTLGNGKFAVKIGGADTEVLNSGALEAAAIELRANGGQVQALAGNTRGIIKATGVASSGGRIFLTAGAGGKVTATQTMVARQPAPPKQAPVPLPRPDFAGGAVQISGGSISLGGSIDVSGTGAEGGSIIAVAAEQLTLTATAALDASGSMGGLILLGGDYQGDSNAATRYHSAAIGTTASTNVAQGARIMANGDSGAGGNVVVWGDRHTDFAGAISATGLTRGGDAEVSGKATLAFTGTADLRAASGVFGTLLLDPYNIIISGDADSNPVMFVPHSNDSVINVGTLQVALNFAHVIISTGGAGSPGAQAGDITIAAPLSWTTGASLTLQAHGSIVINAAVSASGPGLLTLDTGSAGALSFGAGGMISFGAGAAAGRLAINGLGHTLIFDMQELQAIGASDASLQGHYALAGSLDASGFANWAPIGIDAAGAAMNADAGFSGQFTGLGHAIDGLNINRTTTHTGLFGVSSGNIADIGLTNMAVWGASNTGGLVGTNNGTITRSSSSGGVMGDDGVNYLGGLVGANGASGVIADSSSTSSVTLGQGGSGAGGLVGINDQGAISGSSASGAVSGGRNMGGLVGLHFGVVNAGVVSGTISTSYATGTVTGGASAENIGGLVGNNEHGKIAKSYATGAVQAGDNARMIGGLVGRNMSIAGGSVNGVFASYATGTVTVGDSFFYVGGLAGTNFGTITRSHATGAVSGGGDGYSLGGLVGGSDGMISYVYATGAVSSGSNMIFLGGLLGLNADGIVTEAYATGSVRGGAGATNVGGLVGYNSRNGNGGYIGQVFATGAVSGDAASKHLGGLVGGQFGGDIFEAYATGAVSGGLGSTALGGLLGYNDRGNVSDAYWDLLTSGQASSAGGGVGLSTAQLQGVLQAGFDPLSWGIGAGLYPYLKSFFPNGVQVVSGFATKADGSAMASGVNGAVPVIVASGRATAGSASTGANGYYYVFVPTGTLANPDGLASYTLGDALTGAENAAFYRSGTPNATLNSNFDLIGDWRRAEATQSTSTALNNAFGATLGMAQYVPHNNVEIKAAGDFIFDQPGAIPGTFRLSTPGSITLAVGGTVTGKNVELIAGGAFINQQGADAVTAGPGGRWLIYSADPANTVFGDLDSGNTAIWNMAAGAAVTQTGNRYVFAAQPTLTLTATANLSKSYGDDITALLAATPVTVTGYHAGVAKAFRADTLADVLSGMASVVSAGAGATAGVSGAPYAITLGQGTLVAISGYAVAFSGSGALMVTPRAVAVQADAMSRLYGTANPALAYTALGLVNGDTLSGQLATTATAASPLGAYAITQGTLGSPNYALSFSAGTLTILPASSSFAAVPQPWQAARRSGQTTPLTLCSAGILFEAECRNYVNPINRDIAFVAFAP